MNSKGFTVVELIASFALTMIITVFLFEVLIEVKDVFADAGTKSAIQQKFSIISKNIKNNLTSSASVQCTSENTCNINGHNLTINQSGRKITINGQNFEMPDTVNIKSYNLNQDCYGNNCYLNIQMVLTSGNLKHDYNYDVTYYYSS